MIRDGESMAIIRRPKFGVGDRGRTWLQFETCISESSAAQQVLEVEDAAKVIEAYGVSDVARLDGKPCWVDTSEPGRILWSRPLVIA